MINSFQQLFEQVNIVESSSIDKRVGLYPGAFKPPHVGHFEAARMALKQNDVVFVLVSGMTRGDGEKGITIEQSVAIWRLYKQYLKANNLKIVPVDTWNDPDTGNKSTVITATYDTIHLLNTDGVYESSGRFLQPHPVAKEIQNFLRNDHNLSVRVYAGAEDFKGRYSGLPFESEDVDKRYTGRNVIKILKGLPPRLASARDIRPAVATYRSNQLTSANAVRERILQGAISHDDFSSVRKNLPGDEQLKDQVIDILLN